MRKTLALLLIVLLLLGSFPALAVSPTELNTLARYFPTDTPMFVSARIDDGYIETLDGLLGRFVNAFPDNFPPISLTDVLDEFVQDADLGESFAEDVRPWLGDTASLGLIDMSTAAMNDEDPPVLIAIGITDRDAVVGMLSEMGADSDDVEVVTEADYTLFQPADDMDEPVAIIVRDDVLLFTNAGDVLPAGGVYDISLADNSAFMDTLVLLPEPDYNITIYLDTSAFLDAAMVADPDMQAMMDTMGPLMNVIGQQVVGFTILDGVSMTMDFAQKLGDTTIFEEMGIPTALPPLDPAFTARIPAGTALAVQGTDLKTTFESATAGMQMSLEAQADMMDEMGMGDDMADVQEGLDQLGQAFTMFTGLDFEEDVLSWMTGDYAIFLSPAVGVDFSSMGGLMGGFPLTFGLAIEVGDAAAAQNTVDGLTQAVTNLARSAASDEEEPITVSSETIGSTEVTVVTIATPDLPWLVELLMGANDEVFALGTRDAVSMILSPDGGLPSDPAYIRAQDFMLPETVQFAWIGFDALLPLADLAGAFSFDEDTATAQTKALRNALSLFTSSTITARMVDDTTSVGRAVLTFPE